MKPGTGLPVSECYCPYCIHHDHASQFLTPEQVEYGTSLLTKKVMEEIIDPFLEEVKGMFDGRGALGIRVSATRDDTPEPTLRHSEEKLETWVICDACSLQFAIYGVFSHCPDCASINAFAVFRESLEVLRKEVLLLDADDAVLQRRLKNILGDAVSSFDALGKELRRKFTELFPSEPKNLFQNVDKLTDVLRERIDIDLPHELNDFQSFRLMFQVRHIYEHNMGVIDEDFVKRMPSFAPRKGKRFPLVREGLVVLLDQLEVVSELLRSKLPSMEKLF